MSMRFKTEQNEATDSMHDLRMYRGPVTKQASYDLLDTTESLTEMPMSNVSQPTAYDNSYMKKKSSIFGKKPTRNMPTPSATEYSPFSYGTKPMSQTESPAPQQTNSTSFLSNAWNSVTGLFGQEKPKYVPTEAPDFSQKPKAQTRTQAPISSSYSSGGFSSSPMSQKMDHGPRSPLRNGLVANDDNDDIFTPQKQLTVPSNRSTNDSILSAVSEQPNLASFESQKATDQRSVTPQLPSLNEKTERSYGGALSRTEESISFSDDYSDMYTTPTPESPSSRLLNKRYEIVRRIGRGAFGVVQLVKDTKTGNEYALKMIECTDMMELNRAMQEVFPVKDISHEGLVRYLDVFVHEDKDSTGTVTTKFCILMNYYSEGDMLQMIEKRFAKEEYFDEKQALSYMKQLAEGVHHLHQKTLIHRDLKPQNVFVANNEKSLFIGDFGLVTKLEKTFLSTVAGTLRFMAPEVLSNKKYEYAADVWSLGCIFYELLTLRLDRNMYMDVFSKPDFYRDLIKEIKDQLGYSQDLSRLLVDMFEIQPGLRVTTEQVLKRIEKMQKGEYSETKEDTLMCEGECGKIAHVECVGCKSFLCNNCFSDSHKFGAMKKHEKIALNVPNIDWDEKEKKKKKEPTPLVIDSNAPETSWGAMRRDKKEKSYSEQKSKYDDEDVGEKEKPKKKSMAVSSKKERKKNSDEATPTFFENVPKKSLNYDYMDKEDEDDDDGSINDDLYESDDDDDEMIRQISGPINVGFTGSNRKAPAKPMPQQVQKLSKKK